MGRTQPSYTRAVDQELETLRKIALHFHSNDLEKLIEKSKEKVRYLQSASYDEFFDPYNLVILSMLITFEEELEKWKNTCLTLSQSKEG
ncbi:DNA polymerase II [Acidianus manzaensis]|uniref:DNA polymerase II n=2 Tax=Acidianus manzaensis TaxID=282676 RepID=A0A1W6K3H4_9CREN|nr:DNA polymerase II [Acidianus manzaensis]